MMRRYVSIYFSILYMRYRAGIVTDEMIALPKSPFLAIGILEAIGVASGMASAGILFIQFNINPLAFISNHAANVCFCVCLIGQYYVFFTAMLPGPAIPLLNQVTLIV